MKRIDSLKPGTRVTLAFHKRASTAMAKGGRVDEEQFTFYRMEGEGDQRRAVFQYVEGPDNDANRWSAYRYEGRWAFGSSAERLQLLAIHA